MSATALKNLPRPDIPPLLGIRRLPDRHGDDEVIEYDEFDTLRLTRTQPVKKKVRSCVEHCYDDQMVLPQLPEITPQRILSTEDRRALNEEAEKHGHIPRCPDTPVRTPLRRSFRGASRMPTTKTPESGGMSLDMIEIVERLGEGSFGVVHKVRYKQDGQLYALKIMKEGYVSMPPESGVTRLKYDDDSANVDHYHFFKHSSEPSEKDQSSSSSSQHKRIPSTSLLVLPSKQSQEHEEKDFPKPVALSFDDDDDGDDDSDGADVDLDDDDIPLSPRMPTLHYTNCFPKKRKQIYEAEHQSAISEHPNIVAIKAFWEEPNGQFCIMSELCGSSLSTIISHNIDGFDEKTLAGYARDLLSAVAHIHKHGVIHLDIKPANILISLDSSCLKITDFGQAYKKGSGAKPEEGDGRYMAPELLRDIYTPAADIFSLGMTLYELCTPGLLVPYQGPQWDALRHDNIDFSRWQYSKPLQELIRSMLRSDHHERPTAEELLASDYFKAILCEGSEVPFSEGCSSSASTP